MGWKPAEPPLNLIHILPENKVEKSGPKSPARLSHPMRLQIGGETPPFASNFVFRFGAMLRGGMSRLVELAQAGTLSCQGGVRRIGGALSSLVGGVYSFVRWVGQQGVHVVRTCTQGVKQLSPSLGGMRFGVKRKQTAVLHPKTLLAPKLYRPEQRPVNVEAEGEPLGQPPANVEPVEAKEELSDRRSAHAEAKEELLDQHASNVEAKEELADQRSSNVEVKEELSDQRSTKLEKDELLWEVHGLRDQLAVQRGELTRVTAQVTELKALAESQQQVLLHLGQELESIEAKTAKPEKPAPRKTRPRTPKASKSKPLPTSPQSSTDVPLTLDPPS